MIQQGDILIANPYLQNTYFKRTVIYLCEHTSQGSLGFVMNKPHGIFLKDIFPHLKHGHFPLFEGGPVSSQELFYTHTIGLKLSDSVEVSKGVYMGGNFEELSRLIEQKKINNTQIKFFVGCSSWGEKQLDNEILREDWFLQPAIYDELVQSFPDELWGNELAKINPSFKAFSDFSFDPSLN